VSSRVQSCLVVSSRVKSVQLYLEAEVVNLSVELVDSSLQLPDAQVTFFTKIFNEIQITDVLWERNCFGARRYDFRALTS